MDGDFIDPAAFRLRTEEDGQLEEGLSVNWVEYVETSAPKEAVQPLCDILRKKGRKVEGESRFALFEVGAAKAAAAQFVTIAVVMDEELPHDPSHALVISDESVFFIKFFQQFTGI